MDKNFFILSVMVHLFVQVLCGMIDSRVNFQDGKIYIDADYIGYQAERNYIYCRGNVEIITERGIIHSQQALLDLSSQEIHASGSIRFQRADVGEYRAEHLRYNYEFDYLYVEELKGHEEVLVFFMRDVYSHSHEEIQGRDGWISPCKMVHPPFRIKAREMEIYLNERVYVRGAQFCIHHTPVLYLPFYSKNLGEKTPWSVSAGYASGKGGVFKIGYLFRQKYYADRRQDERLSRWSLLLRGEHYSRRGTGILSYGKIDTLDDRWKGRLFGYYIEDDQYDISRRLHEDDIVDKYKNDVDRFTFTTENRFELPRNWLWFLNFEVHSDPDIYLDFVETDVPEELKVERGVESVFSRVFDEHFFLLSLRYKERLNRSIYRDTYRHWADDSDFDGIDYYRTQMQLPVATLERKYLPLSSSLMYKYQLDFFNVHDPGLMPQNAADDKWLTGFMLDNKMFFSHFFSPRISFQSESGIKSGYVAYSEEEFGDQRFYEVANQTGQWLSADIVDNAYNQIDSSQVSPYSLNTLNYHLAQNLRLYSFYQHVKNFGYTSGDFFREIADHRFKEDVYPFPLETRLLGGGFEHTWDSPRYRLNFEFAENLRSDLFPRETIRYTRSDISVHNIDETLSLFAGPAWHKINDLLVLYPDGIDSPGEYYDYERDIYSIYTGFTYRYQQRWQLSVILNASHEKEDHPERPTDRRILEEIYAHLTTDFQLKISDKYQMNTYATYDINESDFGYISVGLSRRIPCLYIGVNVQMRKNLDEFSRKYEDTKFRYAFYFGFEGVPGAGFNSREVTQGLTATHQITNRFETLSR